MPEVYHGNPLRLRRVPVRPTAESEKRMRPSAWLLMFAVARLDAFVRMH